MIKYYKAALSVVATAFLLAGTWSCTKEDMDDCPDNRLRVQLKLDVEVMRSMARAQNYDIDCVHLWVFGKDGTFAGSAEGGAYIQGQDYFLYPKIGAGEYKFVVWTNQGDFYKPSFSLEDCQLNKPSFSDLILYLDCSADNCVRTDIPDLHHGLLERAVVADDRDNLFTVVVTPNTNILNFSVEGLPATTDSYGFTVEDNNSQYYFDNTYGPCTGLQYIRTSQFADNTLSSSMKVLRLGDTRTPVFTLDNTTATETLFTDNLVSMIKKAYTLSGQTVDFDKTHVFDIKIKFDTNMNVTVTVNGWNYTHTPGQLG